MEEACSSQGAQLEALSRSKAAAEARAREYHSRVAAYEAEAERLWVRLAAWARRNEHDAEARWQEGGALADADETAGLRVRLPDGEDRAGAGGSEGGPLDPVLWCLTAAAAEEGAGEAHVVGAADATQAGSGDGAGVGAAEAAEQQPGGDVRAPAAAATAELEAANSHIVTLATAQGIAERWFQDIRDQLARTAAEGASEGFDRQGLEEMAAVLGRESSGLQAEVVAARGNRDALAARVEAAQAAVAHEALSDGPIQQPQQERAAVRAGGREVVEAAATAAAADAAGGVPRALDRRLLEQQIEAAQAESVEQRGRLESVTAEKEALEEQVRSLEADIKAQTAAAHSALAARREETEALAAAQQREVAMQTELSAARRQAAQLVARTESLTTAQAARIGSLTSANASLEKRARHLQRELDTARAEGATQAQRLTDMVASAAAQAKVASTSAEMSAADLKEASDHVKRLQVRCVCFGLAF